MGRPKGKRRACALLQLQDPDFELCSNCRNGHAPCLTKLPDDFSGSAPGPSVEALPMPARARRASLRYDEEHAPALRQQGAGKRGRASVPPTDQGLQKEECEAGGGAVVVLPMSYELVSMNRFVFFKGASKKAF